MYLNEGRELLLLKRGAKNDDDDDDDDDEDFWWPERFFQFCLLSFVGWPFKKQDKKERNFLCSIFFDDDEKKQNVFRSTL